MYNNLIDGDDVELTVSSVKPGFVSNVLKEGTGSALMQALGAYTGEQVAQYRIEIDNVDAGNEIGEATFKWEDSLGDGASGVATSDSEVSLNESVAVKWIAGSGDDFGYGDIWWFKGSNYYRPTKIVDYNRDRRYRSNTLDGPNYIIVDLGSAQACTAFCLMDHNFTDSAVVKLQANDNDDSGAWVSPPFEETVTVVDHYICEFFTSTNYQFWRIEISDAGNPDGHIEIGEIFLGTYLELPGFAYGHSNNLDAIVLTEEVLGGVKSYSFQNIKRTMAINLVNPVKADRDNLWSMFSTITSKTYNYIRPVFIYLDEYLYLVMILKIYSKSQTYLKYNIPLTFEEVLTTL
jgi:hypothetical protein